MSKTSIAWSVGLLLTLALLAGGAAFLRAEPHEAARAPRAAAAESPERGKVAPTPPAAEPAIS